MSRIDQALRRWESANGASPADTRSPLSPNASALGQYPHEAPSWPSRDEPRPSPPIETPPPDRLVSRPPATRVAALSDGPDRQARLVSGTSNSVSLEQYRRLGAVLLEEQASKQLKTVMITSAVPKEGKTLTVVNIALTLAESYGRRVLAIDADLRCPGMHTLFNLPNDQGLSEGLRDGTNDPPFISVSSRLSVLTAGRPGATPLAGLTSSRMTQLLEHCAARFDWVLVDTPPIGVLPDAQVLARLVGAVIFVIGAGSTPAAAVERAVAEIGPDSIIGTVLNRVDDRIIPHADYYGHYYSSSAYER